MSGKAGTQLNISSKLHLRRNSTSGFYFPQKLLPNRNESHMCWKQKSGVGWEFRPKEAKIYLDFLLSWCVLHPGRRPVCNTLPPALSRGSGRAAESGECEIAHAHARSTHVSACQHAFVYTSTVCRLEAGALLSQAITFTSTPNLSWVSRVRVKAEEVTARKWLLPHGKWERNRGQWLGKGVAPCPKHDGVNGWGVVEGRGGDLINK